MGRPTDDERPPCVEIGPGMNWRSLIAGALGLALLEAVLARPGAAGRLGSAETGLGNMVRIFLDPATPFFESSGKVSTKVSKTNPNSTVTT